MTRVMQHIGLYRGQAFTQSWKTPRIPARWCEEIAFLLTVEGFTGTPTTASLRVTPQIAAMHTRNQLERDRFESTQEPLWADLTPAKNPGMLPDGAFGEVATHTLGAVNNDGSSAVVIPKRVGGGYWTRLSFDLSMTGGTSPAVQVSLEAVLRG